MNRELNLDAKNIHEAIELQAQREGFKPKPIKPLMAPVLAKPHTPIYKMHRYYARRPHNVFAKLIEHYTNPGDLILDPFCGGGVTVVEALKLRRRVIGVDINPLATWITRTEVEQVDLDILKELFDKWFSSIEDPIKELFMAKCPNCDKNGIAEWYEWSNVVICPNCGDEVILGNAKKIRAGLFECQNKRCKGKIEPSSCDWKSDKLLSVMVSCDHCGKKQRRNSIDDDERRFNKICKNERELIKKNKLKIPNDKFPDMDRARDDNIFGKGIKYFKDLMTARQRIAHAIMVRELKKLKSQSNAINSLMMTVSATIRFTNKMVIRSEAWRGDKPLEWPGHNYWLAFSYLEASPLYPILNRFKAISAGKADQEKNINSYCKFPKSLKAWEELQNGATCWILTQSSHDIKLPDASVDAIITDPPFGGNVQYGELSDFYLVWLKDFLNLKGLSDKSHEAIETRHQGFEGAKDREFYENMLYKVFKECRRVLKPDGWMSLTFHNRDIGVWMSLHRAALRAGFKLPDESESPNRGMIYQPPVQNYTQTIHQRAAGSMLGDFILSFKPIEPPAQLEAIKAQLSSEEEKRLQSKAEEIIRYHGGADDTTLMTGLIPYLYELNILHRIARYDFKFLLENGPFVFLPKEKKWVMNDMVEESGKLKPINLIPAEVLIQNLVHSYLQEHVQATMDELLVVIYTNLVNAHRPQISTIGQVLSKYCVKKKAKGQNREYYIWNPRAKTPDEIAQVSAAQLALGFDSSLPTDHNSIIEKVARFARVSNLDVHIGETEQRKSPSLSSISIKLSGLELGLSPQAFKYIKEIDLLILKNATILSALEVATSISTFNKAINDRFRNLITIAPNLSIKMNVIVSDVDYMKAHEELYTPANNSSGISSKIKLHKLSELGEKDFLERLI